MIVANGRDCMKFRYLFTYIKKPTKNVRNRTVKAIFVLDKSNLSESRIIELG